MKSNKSKICFCEIAFLVVLNFFLVQKFIFGHFWNCKKWILVKKFREIDLFDFPRFFWPGLFSTFWPTVLSDDATSWIFFCHFLSSKLPTVLIILHQHRALLRRPFPNHPGCKGLASPPLLEVEAELLVWSVFVSELDVVLALSSSSKSSSSSSSSPSSSDSSSEESEI